jgi:hypothetical protein
MKRSPPPHLRGDFNNGPNIGVNKQQLQLIKTV